MRIVTAFTMVSLLACVLGYAGEDSALTAGEKLKSWRKGIWISGTGTYTVYSDRHYFVISSEGDSANQNLYYASSQVSYHQKGMTRHQVTRYRQRPGDRPLVWKKSIFTADHSESPPPVDTTLFTPGICVIQDGVIYDYILEATDTYVLLATCNGDREKIFNDGRSAYLPAAGGQFWSYRVEKL